MGEKNVITDLWTIESQICTSFNRRNSIFAYETKNG